MHLPTLLSHHHPTFVDTMAVLSVPRGIPSDHPDPQLFVGPFVSQSLGLTSDFSQLNLMRRSLEHSSMFGCME